MSGRARSIPMQLSSAACSSRWSGAEVSWGGRPAARAAGRARSGRRCRWTPVLMVEVSAASTCGTGRAYCAGGPTNRPRAARWIRSGEAAPLSNGLVTFLPDRFNNKRAFAQGPQQVGLRLGQVEPSPVFGPQDGDLPVVVGPTSSLGAVVSIVKAGGFSPSVSRQRPAIPMNGQSFGTKRCFAFG